MSYTLAPYRDGEGENENEPLAPQNASASSAFLPRGTGAAHSTESLPPPVSNSYSATTNARIAGKNAQIRSTLVFLAYAIISAFLFHFFLIGYQRAGTMYSSSPSPSLSSKCGSGQLPVFAEGADGGNSTDRLPMGLSMSEYTENLEGVRNHSHAYYRPGLGNYVAPDEDEWTEERVDEMVAGTRGYYVRDFSLYLGWNNMRYILEAALLQSKLLNRTLVIPSYVYARACERPPGVCATYAEQVNRGTAVGSTEWIWLPEIEQQGWRIPMPIMVDLAHLRKYTSVITVDEFKRINNITGPDSGEPTNGDWNVKFHDIVSASRHSSQSSSATNMTYAAIENKQFDPPSVVLVDKMETLAIQPSGAIYAALVDALDDDNSVMDLERAKDVLKNLDTFGSEDDLVRVIQSHGFSVLHTFASYSGMEWVKSVASTIKQVAPTDRLKDFTAYYGNWPEDIIHLKGETHVGRKPGAVRFTTTQAREDFQKLVLYGILHISPIEVLADAVAARMRDLNHGRMWMAAHMRRGDFIRYTWVMENSIEKHVERVKSRLKEGAKILDYIRYETGARKTYDIPGIKPDPSFKTARPPEPDDKFYVSTDERNASQLEYIRSQGGVLLSDLLHPDERRIVGWPLMVTDVVALLEQSVMGHSAYFYGHAMSSFTGGVVNARSVRGMDPRTFLVD